MKLLLETPVLSSWIEDIEYNEEEGYIELTLLNGNEYHVIGKGRNAGKPVPEKLYQRWIRAPSKGRFWHKNIKNKYYTVRQ